MYIPVSTIAKIREMDFLTKGMRVKILSNNMMGTIIGGNESANIKIRFDGENIARSHHPKFILEYFGLDGETIKKYHS